MSFLFQVAILNTKKKGVWGQEEKQGLMNIAPGRQCDVSVMCDDDDFKVRPWRCLPVQYNHTPISVSWACCGDINWADMFCRCFLVQLLALVLQGSRGRKIWEVA